MNTPITNLGGKSLFCYRLGNALKDMGVLVVGQSEPNIDVALHPIRIDPSIKAAKHVVRIDGVYHNNKQLYEKKNASIKKSVHQADGVVYQSYHSKRLADAFVGETKAPSTIIYNGSKSSFYDTHNADTYHPSAIAFAKWRPHKRLKDIVESFLLIANPKNVLFVVGDTEKSGLSPYDINAYTATGNIIFTGDLSQMQLRDLLSRVMASIHLCWFDACPNSVVEALCAGVPVISNNVGGTPELLEKVGLKRLICPIDKPYDYKPCDLYNPPPINTRLVGDQIRRCLRKPQKFDNTPLQIENVAKQYLDFFEKVMG